jgi:hypothetical protein
MWQIEADLPYYGFSLCSMCEGTICVLEIHLSCYSFVFLPPESQVGRSSVAVRGTMLQTKRSRVRLPMRSLDFFHLTSSFQPHYGPGVDSASNRNEYQEPSWEVNGGRRVGLQIHRHLSADWQENVGASTSPILWAFTACYGDTFTFYLTTGIT